MSMLMSTMSAGVVSYRCFTQRDQRMGGGLGAAMEVSLPATSYYFSSTPC